MRKTTLTERFMFEKKDDGYFKTVGKEMARGAVIGGLTVGTLGAGAGIVTGMGDPREAAKLGALGTGVGAVGGAAAGLLLGSMIYWHRHPFGHDIAKISKRMSEGLLSYIENLEAPRDYVMKVSKLARIPEPHVRDYVRNIRPHRFLITPEQFAKDIKPIWSLMEKRYKPLQAGLIKTRPGSPEARAYMAKHGKDLDRLLLQWFKAVSDLAAKYRGGSPDPNLYAAYMNVKQRIQSEARR